MRKCTSFSDFVSRFCCLFPFSFLKSSKEKTRPEIPRTRFLHVNLTSYRCRASEGAVAVSKSAAADDSEGAVAAVAGEGADVVVAFDGRFSPTVISIVLTKAVAAAAVVVAVAVAFPIPPRAHFCG